MRQTRVSSAILYICVVCLEVYNYKYQVDWSLSRSLRMHDATYWQRKQAQLRHVSEPSTELWNGRSSDFSALAWTSKSREKISARRTWIGPLIGITPEYTVFILNNYRGEQLGTLDRTVCIYTNVYNLSRTIYFIFV